MIVNALDIVHGKIIKTIFSTKVRTSMRIDVKTNVIKRNGEEVYFDLTKIINAIKAANN